MEGWHSKTMRCLCHDLDCCPDYEAWCSEQEAEEWWNSLTEEEKASLSVSLCNNCFHGFDDNPGKEICKTCYEWAEAESEHGINF